MKPRLFGLVTIYLSTIMFSFAAESKVFISESRQVLPEFEWNREIIAGINVKIKCEIENSEGALNVILIAERSYKALMSGDSENMKNEDLIFYKESTTGKVQAVIKPPRIGSYWFILKNEAKASSKITLKCSNI
ncbi:hypothetical protein ISG33_02680 [Glaciecola sp. MH2013]|uniref:hypothetical protein n=1 Tax=Glaciecola sp. MH2013 TaxID=2785524 RepID=UPI00189E1A6D|nr:hypothetical protein [Glaciecola sp. MH2013]MBF7072308.1 hypothetical protein [Glaciecola sp. MH2013]